MEEGQERVTSRTVTNDKQKQYSIHQRKATEEVPETVLKRIKTSISLQNQARNHPQKAMEEDHVRAIMTTATKDLWNHHMSHQRKAMVEVQETKINQKSHQNQAKNHHQRVTEEDHVKATTTTLMKVHRHQAKVMVVDRQTNQRNHTAEESDNHKFLKTILVLMKLIK